ncbi:unnamed protein product [Plutella xylostella]|uniref:(diamondback moth) hypothetical protein n=1 Tax=Plutella xylostella TaxID=51655 RepID=A0A8S4FSI3_PLUXY|nr:unnamed protein product [Plutella xylostella]
MATTLLLAGALLAAAAGADLPHPECPGPGCLQVVGLGAAPPDPDTLVTARLRATSLPRSPPRESIMEILPAMGSSVTGMKKCKEDEDTITLESGHMFYHQEGDQLSQGGVGFFVNKTLVNNVVEISSTLNINFKLERRCLVKSTLRPTLHKNWSCQHQLLERTTVLQKGDQTLLKNYRPISLLSHVYKLFSRVITNGLAQKLDEFQHPEQAGFQKGFSTIDHIHTVR